MPLDETIALLSQRLPRLDAGALAELRRMDIGGVGPLPYWALAAECGFLDETAAAWMRIVHILALLTPKGERQPTDRLHDPERKLGRVLCDGGDPSWPPAGGDPRPVVSESRLARLLTTPADQRGEALTRLARMLAARRDRASGVNCKEIAALLLFEDVERNLQQIAKAYYRRLDSATRKAEKEDVQ
ncbi:CRISPR system Cascade subunit CasB [Rhodoblastus acidophilus]|uniref:type I-E CRISPR-associated protein Cse2/CasB n=1 Tax=Rhodoblastus acidophilus TaxID=1074 RepID=UPI0022258FD7|nr:type I-E CRISPR-associated protein Cse2/CasB [Rhodoblastus acidophilus]MCW2286077.1 CRISPR system Cascade subunit CasB [Rhodoblastus acidophilus]MCW2334971.1 CRISPR system Cascade subunit CasB [Rhodoblastus acidophilus]